MNPIILLYLALGCYALGTFAAFASLFTREKGAQNAGLVVMMAGLVSHTVWIGTICARTGHPPLTNLSETVTFLSWTILTVIVVLYIRYRVYAASFFVYPLVLLLLLIAAVIGEPLAQLDPALRSTLFIAHIFLTTVGVAGLFVGLAFTMLAWMQDRSLKSKRRGRLWEWIPSLDVCNLVSYRALAIGFSIYTVGLLAGVLWSYRTTAGPIEARVKQISAVIAWLLFAALLQTYISGSYRSKRTIFISVGAFVAILVSILGIARV